MVCTLFVHRKGDVEEGEKKNEMEGSQNYTVGGGREERKDVRRKGVEDFSCFNDFNCMQTLQVR